MTKPEASKIEKLPRWAQDYIRDLERVAEDLSREYIEKTTPNPDSDIYVVDSGRVFVGNGFIQEMRYKALQHHREINFRLKDTEVSVLLRKVDIYPSVAVTFEPQVVAPMPSAANVIKFEYRPRVKG